MPQTCRICALDEAALTEVNLALLRGEPIRVLARRLSLSRDSLARHARKHLCRALAPAYSEKELSQAHRLREQLDALRNDARRIKEQAEQEGDLRTALQAVRELTRLVELVAKLSGALTEHPTTNILNVNLDAERGPVSGSPWASMGSASLQRSRNCA